MNCPNHEPKNKSSNSVTLRSYKRKNILSQRFDLINIFYGMEFLIFFSLAAVVIMVLILKFDKKQTIEVNAVLKKTRHMSPLYPRNSLSPKLELSV